MNLRENDVQLFHKIVEDMRGMMARYAAEDGGAVRLSTVLYAFDAIERAFPDGDKLGK